MWLCVQKNIFPRSAYILCLILFFLIMAGVTKTASAQVSCVPDSVDVGNPIKASELCCYFVPGAGQDYQCWGRPNGGDQTTGTFEVSANDPDGDRVYFDIDWGDGVTNREPPVAPNTVASGTVLPLTHDFTGVGSFVTIARVTDDGIPPLSAISKTITSYISEIKDLTKASNASFAIPGQSFRYTITFKIGSQRVRNLQVREEFLGDALNNGAVVYLSSAGKCFDGATELFSGIAGDEEPGDNRVIWDIEFSTYGDLPAGSECTFTIDVQAGSPAADPYNLQNTATVEALNADPVTSGVVTVQIITGDPWFQTFWGDLHSDGGIGQDAHGDTVYYVISAVDGFDAGITSWKGYTYPDYHALASIFTVISEPSGDGMGNIWQKLADDPNDPIALWEDALDPDSNNVWIVSGDMQIAPNGIPIYLSRGGTVIVTGNLEIGGDLFYAPYDGALGRQALPSVGFIVGGNVTVSPDVNHLVGAFRVDDDTEGIFKTESINPGAKEDKSVRIDGSIYARKFELEREVIELDDTPYPPSEGFYYDGRVLVNTPPGFEAPNNLMPTWRRIEVP